jgi:signal transduction histidine kinase
MEIGKLAKVLRGCSSAQPQFFCCNLVEIVRETMISQQEFAAHRVFEMELPGDEPVGVSADADRIKQALTNYLTNALKFSPDEQPIRMVVEVHDIQAQVSVQDKGSGVPDADQSRIWEWFWRRQKQSARSRSGLGLGLYITRAIINQHHGQVGIESRKGREQHSGSRFRWLMKPGINTRDRQGKRHAPLSLPISGVNLRYWRGPRQ